MRHGKKFNHLSRKAPHRNAMLANMACSLIEHKRINTTVAKAKALRKFVEPLVTKSKSDTTHNRRIVFSRLKDKYAVAELFRDVSAKIGDRPGGYTRIIKLGHRLGDNAQMAMIELVDYNELYDAGKPEKKKSTRRSRRSKKAVDAPVTEKETVTTDVEDASAISETAQEAENSVDSAEADTTKKKSDNEEE